MTNTAEEMKTNTGLNTHLLYFSFPEILQHYKDKNPTVLKIFEITYSRDEIGDPKFAKDDNKFKRYLEYEQAAYSFRDDIREGKNEFEGKPIFPLDEARLVIMNPVNQTYTVTFYIVKTGYKEEAAITDEQIEYLKKIGKERNFESIKVVQRFEEKNTQDEETKLVERKGFWRSLFGPIFGK